MSLRAAATTLTGVSALGFSPTGRTELRERDAQPVAGRSDHLRLVPLDRGDRSVHAERRSLDGVAGRERPGLRQRLVEGTDRPLRPHGPLGGRPEPAVALRLVAPLPPRHPDLVPTARRAPRARSPARAVPRRQRALVRPRRTRAPPRSRPRAPARAPSPRRAARRPPRARLPPPRAPRRLSARPPRPPRAAPRSAVVRARPARARRRRPPRRGRAARRSGARARSPGARERCGRAGRASPGRTRWPRWRRRRSRSPTPSAPRSGSSRPSGAPAPRAGPAAPVPAPSLRPDPCRPRPRRAARASAPSRRSRIATRLATWPEKVERLISIDWRSPMSASTASKTGSAAVSAGGRRPDWCSSAARPSVFSATVLPPVFGPLITSARSPPRSRSIGTAVFGSSSGWRAPTSRTSSETSTGAPRQPRETVPSAIARSIRPAASTACASASACSPTATDSSRRIRSASSRSAPAASDWRLLSSTISNGSTKSVWPESEASWTRPGTLLARARLDREHGPAAALGDEVLLQVLADAALAHELLQPVGDALPPGAELAAELAQLRRGVVLQVGAVLLDGAVDRVGERLQRRVDRGRELAQQRRLLLLERRAGAQRAGDRVADVPQRRGGQHPAARGERGDLPDVADPLERRLLGDVEQRDRLGGQRLPARHLARVG